MPESSLLERFQAVQQPTSPEPTLLERFQAVNAPEVSAPSVAPTQQQQRSQRILSEFPEDMLSTPEGQGLGIVSTRAPEGARSPAEKAQQQQLSEAMLGEFSEDMLETPQGQGLGVVSTRLIEGDIIPGEQPKDLSFAERLGADWQQRAETQDEIVEALLMGDQGMAESLYQTFGKTGVGGFMDMVGESLTSAYRLLPEGARETLAETGSDAMTLFLLSPKGQLASQAAMAGAERYGEFAEANPRAARNFESLVNIASVMAPPARAAGPVDDVLTAPSREMLRAAGRQTARRSRRHAENLIRPRDTFKANQEAVEQTIDRGLLRGNEYVLSAAERRMASAVDDIAEVGPRHSLQGNWTEIRNANIREANMLDELLRTQGQTIARPYARSRIAEAQARIMEENVVTGNLRATSDRLVEQAIRLIDEAPQTSQGMLGVRRSFDRWLTQQKNNVLGDVPTENTMTIAARRIRDSMNDMIAEVNPQLAVRESLTRQHLLYGAMERLRPKVAIEKNHAAARLLANARRILPMRNEAIQAFAVGTGVGGLGASMMFAPTVTAVIGGALGAYALGAAVLSPTAKRAVAGLLRVAEEAIAQATNPVMLSQLKKDRDILIEMLQAPDENNEMQVTENGPIR